MAGEKRAPVGIMHRAGRTAMRIDRILVASTLDPSSERVVHAAGALAETLHARLTLVHVVGPPDVSEWMPRLKEKASHRIEEQHLELLRRQAVRLELPEPELLILTGLPEHAIDEACRKVEADLIVIGATTAASPVEGLLGSTAEHLLHKAVRPILLVREPLTVPPARVLAPVDLSPLSNESFQVGLRILEGLSGSQPVHVEILFVLDPARHDDAIPSDPEQALKVVGDHFEGMASDIKGQGNIRLETRVVSGEPGREIIARAKEAEPDLVLLGTRAQGGLRSLFGSVAAYVVRHAPANLLVIPPRANGADESE